MDTDELTAMAYQTITLAYDASEILRAELGASASVFSCEDDFLEGTIGYLDEVLSNPRDYLDTLNALNDTDVLKFSDGVRRLRDHVVGTLKTPHSERGGTGFA
jgi:hypothetical protein